MSILTRVLVPPPLPFVSPYHRLILPSHLIVHARSHFRHRCFTPSPCVCSRPPRFARTFSTCFPSISLLSVHLRLLALSYLTLASRVPSPSHFVHRVYLSGYKNGYWYDCASYDVAYHSEIDGIPGCFFVREAGYR